MGSQHILTKQAFNAPVETVFNELTDHESFGRTINTKIRRIIDSRDDNKNGLGSVRRIHLFPLPDFEEILFIPQGLHRTDGSSA